MVGLEQKEALLLQLRAMNDEAAAGVHSADASGAAAPGFVGAYAGVVLQLKEVGWLAFTAPRALGRPARSACPCGSQKGSCSAAPGSALRPGVPMPCPLAVFT